MRSIRRAILRRAQEGAVLAISLIILFVLTVIGVSMMGANSMQERMAGGFKAYTQALMNAESGIEEARQRLRGQAATPEYAGDPDPFEPRWSAYILTDPSWTTARDPDFQSSYQNYVPTAASRTSSAISANSLQSTLSYWVKLRHKTDSLGNIIYYGYETITAAATTPLPPPVQFTMTPASYQPSYQPVEILAGYGESGNSRKVVEVEAVHQPGPPLLAVLYAEDDVDLDGTSATINGNDACTVAPAPAIPPVYTLLPRTTETSGIINFTGNPATPQVGPLSLDIVSYVNKLGAGASAIGPDQDPPQFGRATDYVTVFSNTGSEITLQNAVGYGLLLVVGDLRLRAAVSWEGLILVTGRLEIDTSATNIGIRGAILAHRVVVLGGNLALQYDSCAVRNALSTQPPSMVRWRQIQ